MLSKIKLQLAPEKVLAASKGSLPIALVVGTFLCIINQKGPIMDTLVHPHELARIGLNYLTPFLVAGYSRLTHS
mgnify:CR=1 FL=1